MSALDKTLQKLESLIQSGNINWDYGFDLRNKNYHTGRHYSGIFNNIVLSMTKASCNYKYPYWIGFGQAIKSYIPVKQGEKGTPIMCKQYKKLFFDETTGMEIDSEDANSNSRCQEKSFWSTVYVFNIEQTSIDIDSVNQMAFSEKPEELEKLLDKYCTRENIVLADDSSDYPYYSPEEDRISLVPKERYYDLVAYYEAWTHECVHSTGHEKRLNRELQTRDKDKYDNEEIVAEFGTMLLLSEFDIEHREKDRAAYISSYLHGAEVKSIYDLCILAQKAVDYIRKGKNEHISI